MERRDFLKIAGATSMVAAAQPSAMAALVSFKDKLCINESTSMPHDFDVCIKGYAKAGVRAVEPWIHKVRQFAEKESFAVAKRLLDDHGMRTPSSCAMGELVEPRDDRQQKIEQLKGNLEIAQKMGFERFVVHSFSSEQYNVDDYKRGADNVRELGEIGESFGVVINIEFIRMQRFIGTLPSSLRIVREANHPYARPLFDFFHFWAGQGKMADLELLQEGEPDHAHFHDTPDMPREILRDADRVFPGEGVCPLRDILEVLRRKNYKGYLSVELFGKQYQEADPYEMAKRAIETTKPFLT